MFVNNDINIRINYFLIRIFEINIFDEHRKQ